LGRDNVQVCVKAYRRPLERTLRNKIDTIAFEQEWKPVKLRLFNKDFFKAPAQRSKERADVGAELWIIAPWRV
jgi:hypothetical protein